jgi:hypothetical protein
MVYICQVLFETKKINLIRKILAIVQLVRTLQIGWCYYHYQNGNILFEETFYLIFVVSLLILLYSGRYILLSSILCAVFIPKFDSVLLVPSIADNLFSFMCLFFSAHYAFVIKMEHPNEESRIKTLDVLYWCLFLSYGVINLLSFFRHIDDVYWLNGSAMGELLMASSISRFFAFFRELNDTTTWFMPLMKMNTWAVLVSQLLLIPLYLFEQTRKLIIIWVAILLFYIFGLMEVVMLPHYSILLFVLIFYRKSKQLYLRHLLEVPKNSFRTFLIVFYSLLGIQVVLNTPFLSKGADKAFWLVREWDTKLWLNKKMSLLGYVQPDVLNTQEIQASSRWFTIYKIINGRKELVPFIDKRGERLNYYPDILYFGNQGSDYIKKNLVAYGMEQDTFTYLNSQTLYKEKGRSETRLIKFDYSASFHHDTVSYIVNYYTYKGIDYKLGNRMTEERRYYCINGEILRITH